MTISSRVRQQFLAEEQEDQLIRIPQTKCHTTSMNAATTTRTCSSRYHQNNRGLWSAMEHERFLQALELFPHGPWKDIAAYIGDKTARQAMCHAQKYRQKIARRKRGLQMSQGGERQASHDASARTEPSDQYQTFGQQNKHHQVESSTEVSVGRLPKGTGCPNSPSVVSSSSADNLFYLSWNELLSAQWIDAGSLHRQTQDSQFAGPFDTLVQQHQPIITDSFSDLLLHDDNEGLLSTMNEFLQ